VEEPSAKLIAVFVEGDRCKDCATIEQLLIKNGAKQKKFSIARVTSEGSNTGGLWLVSPLDGKIVYRSSSEFHPTKADIDRVMSGIDSVADVYVQAANAVQPFEKQIESMTALKHQIAAPIDNAFKQRTVEDSTTLRPLQQKVDELIAARNLAEKIYAEQIRVVQAEVEQQFKASTQKRQHASAHSAAAAMVKAHLKQVELSALNKAADQIEDDWNGKVSDALRERDLALEKVNKKFYTDVKAAEDQVRPVLKPILASIAATEGAKKQALAQFVSSTAPPTFASLDAVIKAETAVKK